MTFVRNHILSLGLILLLANTGMAQDPLEQARKDAILKAQKLKSDINVNLDEARKAQPINPERARDLLRRTRNLLEDDSGTLPEAERKGYLDEIAQRLNQINNRANASKVAEAQAIERDKQIGAFKAKLAADTAKVANAAGPSVVIYGAQKSYKDQQLAMLAYQKAMQDAYLQQQLQQQNPQYYKPPANANTVPDRDIKIMKALDSYLNVDFKAIQMKDVLGYIEDKASKVGELNFILDEAGLKEAGINDPGPTFNNDEITKKFKKIKVRALLRVLLSERGMKYYLEDGNIFLTKDTKADKKLVVKMYPVANSVGGQKLIDDAINELQAQASRGPGPGVGPGNPPGNPGAPAPQLQLGPKGQLLTQNIDGLTNQIKGTIEPDHWQGPANGPGSMVFVPASSSLQIHCSLEVHYLIMASGLLDKK